MTTDPCREPFLAVVEPMAAAWLMRKAVGEMRDFARKVLPYEGTLGAELGRQLLRSAARLEASARWQEEHGAARVVPVEGQNVDGAVEWLTTAEAAVVLGVGPRQVGNYIDGGNGPLPASRKGPGSPWRIRSDDLADFRLWLSEVAV